MLRAALCSDVPEGRAYAMSNGDVITVKFTSRATLPDDTGRTVVGACPRIAGNARFARPTESIEEE